MTPDQFRRTLSRKAPPPGLAPPLAALWWAAKGEWDRAHALVMEDASREAAWVHAYLHRLEGDPGNARYWYRQAGRAAATNAHEAEWEEITQTILQTGVV